MSTSPNSPIIIDESKSGSGSFNSILMLCRTEVAIITVKTLEVSSCDSEIE